MTVANTAVPLWGDFAWRDGGFYIRKTGIHLKITQALVAEIASWVVWLTLLAGAALWARLTYARRLSVWYAPDRPRPWYMCRGIAIFGGIDVAKAPDGADAAFYFEDVTCGQPARLAGRHLNQACQDISKAHVARVFEEVAGYPLALDPRQAAGEIVEKSDKNGVHDGRIVMAPMAPLSGKVYQRVVDTRDDDGCCHDLRTPCIGGEPVVVWVKTKTPEGRFSINNRQARMAEPEAVYSEAERDLIRRFNARIGLDCGGLDILRDRHDGRIYIVDVNKTDVGPVIALSWSDKIRSMARLGRALRRHILETEA
ncbi:hypothetical protein ABAC460_00085 [Asticcacaulis sp. AC460]|uniref:hypothetical protein n=1 Tax=Asticcacaulis sp. AC460 TaxID=1282360 RepID=UPI0003C3F29E|nr:hypothetical protein [Asticcacaulis sp. AC460]ESQ93499.1 hypothetical protein ABAC460_00085 [Asticcacaulis sp. AC460]